MPHPSRRSLSAFVLLSVVASCGSESPRPGFTHGPFLGHVAPESATIWVRTATPCVLLVSLRDAETERPTAPAGGGADSRAGAPPRVVETKADDDCTARIVFDALRPHAAYEAALRISAAQGPAAASAEREARVAFRTPPRVDEPQHVRFVVGSCARETPGKPNPVWPAIEARGPDALLLIGDTPYIDSPRLGDQRRRYAEFFADPGLANLRRTTPTYAVWDDHDFGRNDVDGRMPFKAEARRAFAEWHANPGVGADGEGVDTSFRRGPIEAFLIDARWWSGLEPSFADASRPTLIGAAQWDRLRRGLRASTAPFKLLVSGMVWNDAVRPKKSDYWGAYPHERAALFDFLRTERISGVVLVGGDVHRVRAFRNPTEKTGLAYPLYELISSPLGPNVHGDANVPHPDLLFDRGEPHAFLELAGVAPTDGGPARLSAVWRNAGGAQLHRLDLDAETLRATR